MGTNDATRVRAGHLATLDTGPPPSCESFSAPIRIHDGSGERCRNVAGLLTDLHTVAPSPPASPDRAIFHLVGLDDADPAGPAMLAQIAMCRRSAPVVGYASGADHWPVRTKAALLLAGCTALVDLEHPAGPARLRSTVASILARERERANEGRAAREALEAGGLVGESDALLAVGRWLQRVGPLSDTPAFISGETGTGKELVARAIHRLDPIRRRGPFVPVNCAALSPGLAESDLFGHRRGAFTGAETARAGFVRSAEGGVLFLDEVGDLEPALQAKLLRVLQDQRVVAVGEDRETSVDVRVVAATNRDLDRMIETDRFRLDLFHRLAVVTLRMPPLRERRDDIAPLVRHFLAKHRPRGELPQEMAGEALAALEELDYPGNVRELENLVRAALAAAPSGTPLGLADLPPAVLRRLTAAARASAAAEPCGSPGADGHDELDALACDICQGRRTLESALEECERAFVRRTLQFTFRNQARAARLLGVSARAVYRKVRRLGLEAHSPHD